MYGLQHVAEELWSLCWTDVFITVPGLCTKNGIQNIKCRKI